MNKQTFLAEVEQLTANFTTEQQQLVQTMVEALLPYETSIRNATFYAKTTKDNKAEEPIFSFSVGIKERPLTFVRFTLDLYTNSVKKVESSLAQRSVHTPSLQAPDGTVVHFVPQHFVYSKQKIDVWQ